MTFGVWVSLTTAQRQRSALEAPVQSEWHGEIVVPEFQLITRAGEGRRWIGNISDLHYFIKLIHNTNKSVENLKQHQWEVACKCFVHSDGSQFDRQQLKEQKKPKSKASSTPSHYQ